MSAPVGSPTADEQVADAVWDSRRRGIVLLVVGLLLVAALVGPLGLVAVQGGAEFAASDRLGANQVRAATVELALGEEVAAFEVVDMAPGDRARGTIELRNAGSLRVRYSIAHRAGSEPGDAELGSWLRWDVWRATGATCGPVPANPPVSAVVLRGDGSLLGSAEVGPDPGDQVLPVDGVHLWCLEVELPLDAPDGVQGATWMRDIVFAAEQFPEDDGAAAGGGS